MFHFVLMRSHFMEGGDKMLIGLCMWLLMTATSVDSIPSLEEYDFSEIQSFLEEELPDTKLNFAEIVTELMSGDSESIVSTGLEWGYQLLFSEIEANRTILLNVILIAVIGAVFTNFSSVFRNSDISETGFFITYLLMIGLLAVAFSAAISIATVMLDTILGFMKVLLPTFFLAVTFVGGNLTSAAFYETAFGIISIMEWVLKNIVIPMIGMYITLLFVNQISEKDYLSKTAELLKLIVEWGIKTILGVVLGIQVIQGLVLPFADAIKTNAIQKAVKIIPGVGDSASAISQMVIGGGILIKNGIGTAALIVIVVITVIPLLQLAVITVFYYIAAAIIQPISDERMSNSIAAVAEGSKLLIRVVFVSGFLFFITIVVVCQTTNLSYLGG